MPPTGYRATPLDFREEPEKQKTRAEAWSRRFVSNGAKGADLFGTARFFVGEKTGKSLHPVGTHHRPAPPSAIVAPTRQSV